MQRTVNLFNSFRKSRTTHQSHNISNAHKSGLLPFSVFRVFVGTAVGSTVSIATYDGIVNDFTYVGAGWRFIRSLKTAGLIAIDYFMLQRHENHLDYERKLKRVHQRSANRLLETCLLNGGLYIKVGQGFAAINNILPIEYTRTLSRLQDRCLPTSAEEVQKVFLQDFNCLPEEIYDEFDYKAVAAASLAQVFKAKLKTGEEVAIKVQYSDLQRRFPSDLGTIIFLHNIIELIFKDYNFGWILRDLHHNLVQELNFKNEAKNSERCARDLSKFSFVHVPTVHWDLTKTRVLTMEWINGYRVSDVDKVISEKLSIKDVDIKLFKMFAEQIFNSGFVHADPHASNVFVRRNENSGTSELILLDHGLYEELPEEVRWPLCEFWEATVLRDEVAMAAAARKLNIKDHMKFAEVLFQQPIRVHGGHLMTKLSESDIRYMQEVAKKNFDLIMSTLKEMPRNMLFVVRNLNTVRAIGRSHNDVVDRPRIMARHAQKCLYTHTNTYSGYFRWFFRRIYFEYCLFRNAFKINCMDLYFKALYFVGRAPSSAKTLMKDMLQPDLS